MRTIPVFGLYQPVCDERDVPRQLIRSDVVERVKLIAGVFDNSKRVQNRDLASE